MNKFSKLLNLCIKFAENIENSLDEEFITRIFIYSADSDIGIYDPIAKSKLKRLINTIRNFDEKIKISIILYEELEHLENFDEDEKESLGKDLEINENNLRNNFNILINDLGNFIYQLHSFAVGLLNGKPSFTSSDIVSALFKNNKKIMEEDVEEYEIFKFPSKEIEDNFIPNYQQIFDKINLLKDQFITINLENLSLIIDNYQYASELMLLTMEFLKLLKLNTFISTFKESFRSLKADILYMEEDIYPKLQRAEKESYLRELNPKIRERLDKPDIDPERLKTEDPEYYEELEDKDYDPTLTEEDYETYFAHPSEYIGSEEYRKRLKKYPEIYKTYKPQVFKSRAP